MAGSPWPPDGQLTAAQATVRAEVLPHHRQARSSPGARSLAAEAPRSWSELKQERQTRTSSRSWATSPAHLPHAEQRPRGSEPSAEEGAAVSAERASHAVAEPAKVTEEVFHKWVEATTRQELVTEIEDIALQIVRHKLAAGCDDPDADVERAIGKVGKWAPAVGAVGARVSRRMAGGRESCSSIPSEVRTCEIHAARFE